MLLYDIILVFTDFLLIVSVVFGYIVCPARIVFLAMLILFLGTMSVVSICDIHLCKEK